MIMNSKYNKSIVFTILSIFVGFVELYFNSNTVVFIAFLVMAGFYFLDISSKTKIHLTLEQEFHNKHYSFNKLDYYIIDNTECFGLFIKIFNKPIFIELKEDSLLEKRKQQALHLSENPHTLEENLNIFLKENPVYQEKKFDVILLCYDDITLGDIFWEPTGHTSIKDLIFTL